MLEIYTTIWALVPLVMFHMLEEQMASLSTIFIHGSINQLLKQGPHREARDNAC